MKLLALLLLVCTLTAQTRVQPSQINFQQTDDTFFRQCFVSSTGEYMHAYAYFSMYHHGTTSSSKITSTYLRFSQVANYGLELSADRTTVTVMKRWSFSPVSPMYEGTIEFRMAMNTPNFNLIGVSIGDLKGLTEKGNVGGWAQAYSGVYTRPPLVTLTVKDGRFTFGPFIYFHNTCELWQSGNFKDIKPWP